MGSSDPKGFLFLNLIIGIIFTSTIFIDIHTQDKSMQYFLIPTSIEEKFLVKFLFTGILYFIISIITILLASLISEFFRFVLFHAPFNIFNPIKAEVLTYFGIYIFFHSIFLLGSIIFRNNNFFKTFFFFILIFIVFFFVITILVVSIISNIYNTHQGIVQNFYKIFEFINSNSDTLSIAIKTILMILIPVVLYFLSYFKLKQFQIK